MVWLAVTGSLAALAASGAVVAWAAFGWDPTRVGGDAWNYLAAGERLNAGHDLYALGPTDRPVPVMPPYWSAPLLAPPPIAVAWRPLALLGDSSMVLWSVACLAVVILAVVALARGGPASFAPVALLATPIALTALSGNFGALQLASLVALWTWRDRPILVGALLACVVAVKLTPLTLVVWLLATGRLKALLAFGAAGTAIVAVSVVGAGADAWREWVDVARAAAPSPLAIASITGLSTFGVFVILLAATVGVGTLRRDQLTFVVAVIAGCLATPALYFQALAPLAAIGAVWMVRLEGTWGRWGRDHTQNERGDRERPSSAGAP